MTEDHAEYEAHRALWESRWADPGYVRRWRIGSIPIEVRQAVEARWFAPGAPVLDIGCGEGEIAAWLAGNGYDVLGIDLANGAIERARSNCEGLRGATFEVVDITEGPPRDEHFGTLLDRGCLHGIPAVAAPAYARNIAAAASPGAAFLLLHRVRPDTLKEDVVSTIEELFGTTFRMIRSADTKIGGRPGVAFWMTRR